LQHNVRRVVARHRYGGHDRFIVLFITLLAIASLTVVVASRCNQLLVDVLPTFG